MKLRITPFLDSGVMFNARLYADLIRQSYSGGSAIPPAFSRDSCGRRTVL